VVVELRCWLDDPGDPGRPASPDAGEVRWHAEWGLEDDSVGYELSSSQLGEVVDLIVGDARDCVEATPDASAGRSARTMPSRSTTPSPRPAFSSPSPAIPPR